MNAVGVTSVCSYFSPTSLAAATCDNQAGNARAVLSLDDVRDAIPDGRIDVTTSLYPPCGGLPDS